MKIKTRLAPSPTGYLHVGTLHTFLFNYYFTKKQGGEMILRVEDTDRTRYVEGATEALIAILERMDITYEEGPILQNGKIIQKGSNGSYIQSERLNIYPAHANQLIESGNAYYCFCTKERLSSVREQQSKLKLPTKYDRACLALSKDDIARRLEANESHVIRMKIPEGKTTFTDEILGEITIDHTEVDDQVLIKADGFPTYHLAVVVDDHLMGVTHVIRAVDWVSSVPKHLLLYKWFGWALPVYAHLPLLLNPDKSKLSKRQGDVSVESYLQKGFLKEAMLNFIAILGFNPSGEREIYTQKELMENFEIKKVSKSGPIFDVQKLLWMNGQYINRLTGLELSDAVCPFLLLAGKGIPPFLARICEVEKTRMTLLSDACQFIDFYQSSISYDANLLVWKKSDKADALVQLIHLQTFLETVPDSVFEQVVLLEDAVKRYIKEAQLQTGNVLWPLRVALSCRENSPNPFELIWVFGKAETNRRLLHAITILS